MTRFIHNIQERGGRIFMEILADKCARCGKLLVPEIFLRHVMLRAGSGDIFDGKDPKVAVIGDYFNDAFYCKQCTNAEKHTLPCYICHEEREEPEWYDYYGIPKDILCLKCYNSVPAAKWDETVKELREMHRYDNE